MRMRQEEQRHLHQLTVERMEAVARRFIQQEKRLREFSDEIVMLKERNRNMAQENDRLNWQLSQTRTESAQKEVAVHAMSSAVAGLEGWINSSPTPIQPSRRVVIRGRGRFRGCYYVDGPDGPDGPPVGYGLDGATDAKALHEGVAAWLRGFRDVEEELRSSETAGDTQRKELRSAPENTEDEWGDFEAVPGT